MKRIQNRAITSYTGPWWPRNVGDVELVSCTLQGCSIGYAHSRSFSRRTIVENVIVKDCRISKCLVGPAQLQDIYLENILGGDLLVWGALFKHVTMKGRFDGVLIHGKARLEMSGEELRRYWPLCDRFYADCDWALDISDAEFGDFDIRTRGVPASLVRRDAETQAVVKAVKIREGLWKRMQLGGLVETAFNLWESGGGEDLIIVAPKRNKTGFAEVMTDIRRLRDAGIAEPD